MKIVFQVFFLLTVFFLGLVEASVYYSFEGEFDSRDKAFRVSVQKDKEVALVLNNTKNDADVYELSAKLRHIKLNKFDISGDFVFSMTHIRGKDGHELYEGQLQSQYLLVNYKPVSVLFGNFLLEDNKFTLKDFSLEYLSGSGEILLGDLNVIDLSFLVEDMPMGNLLDIWVADRGYEVNGLISGAVKVLGSFDRPYLKGDLKSKDGKIRTLDFSDFRLVFEGAYPYMQISNSKISQKGGMSFTLEGMINLNDKEKFQKQIKQLRLRPIVRSSDVENAWTIQQAQDDESSGTTSLKYLLRKEIDSNSGNAFGMVGVKRTVEF